MEILYQIYYYVSLQLYEAFHNGHQCLEVHVVGINNSLSLEATSNPQGATTVYSSNVPVHSKCCQSFCLLVILLKLYCTCWRFYKLFIKSLTNLIKMASVVTVKSNIICSSIINIKKCLYQQ